MQPMQAMLEWLGIEQRYRRVSLAVQRDNHAVLMYEKVGFASWTKTNKDSSRLRIFRNNR